MHDATQPISPTQAEGSAPSANPDKTPDLTGQSIGDFQILRRLGQGGMGFVYLAEQRSLKRKVALKFLRAELAANPTALSRFRREAEAVARLNHLNIVQVYFINAEEAPYYMALEYVEGRNLREYLTKKGALDLPVALTVMRQVAAALQRAAESGIVHRDIKPENILLTRKGEVKVADFGLSRDLAGDQDLTLTQPGMAMGTPLYMSPEQAQGNPLDPRSDIYSFGVTCYHMLAGQPPFRGKTAFEVALKHVNEAPPALAAVRPDLPVALIDLVNRMMSKDPTARPQSGRDVLRELSQPLGPATPANPFAGLDVMGSGSATGSAADAIGAGPVTAARPRPVVHKGRWAAGVLAVLLAGAGGVGLRWVVNAHSSASTHDDHPVLPVVSDQERGLLAAIELYAGKTTPDKVRQWAGQVVELGILYWEQKRFGDAERLFDEMAKKANLPAAFKTISTLGLAVTCSLRDEVDRSNKLFLEARGPGAGVKPLIPQTVLPPEDNINLRHWIVTALDRNATRPPAPKELEDLRKELRRRPNMGGASKQG
jgi:predicted Ser/Thr protein kinase